MCGRGVLSVFKHFLKKRAPFGETVPIRGGSYVFSKSFIFATVRIITGN